jgi:hypothetical protein
MAEPKKQTKQAYRVLCWGACKQDGADEEGARCSISYPPDQVAYEGDIVTELPQSSIAGEIAAGHIEAIGHHAEGGKE